MKDNKVYRHIRFQSAEATIDLGKESIKIHFANGSTYPKTNGFFKTNDEELQKAIEKHPQFGKDFFLERVNGKALGQKEEKENTKELELEATIVELKEQNEKLQEAYDKKAVELEEVKLELVEAKKVVPSTPEPTTETPVEETAEVTIIEVANIQAAKKLLKAEPYNILTNKMPNETAVLNRAKEVGVEFKITG